MAIEVFPTANDIGGAGTGRSSTEESIAQLLGLGVGETTILSGFTASAVASELNVRLAPGRASIGGYIIRNPDFITVPVSYDTTGYLLLQLTGADTYDATATAWVETADLSSPPANSALVTKFITSGGAISSVTDRERREGTGTIGGTYTGNGGVGDTQEINLGLTPRLVVARTKAATVNSTYRWAMSNIFPGNVEWDNFDEDRIGIPYMCGLFDEDGYDDMHWEVRCNEDGPGLGIIPDGFITYNATDSDSSTGRGMNYSGMEYVYLAWF